MSRPIRIEFPGAIYHISSRGHDNQMIFLDDEDRQYFLELLGKTVQRFHWICHAYCLMIDHYHLVIETPNGNLSIGMRELNGGYTQRFNRRYSQQGPVMQGRFKAILVERDTHLLQVCRHVVLNPLRTRKVRNLDKYRWSSYRSTAGIDEAVPGVSSEWILSQLAKSRKKALERYQEYVKAGAGLDAPWSQVQKQILLGSPEFVEAMQGLMSMDARVKVKPVRPSLKKIFAKVKDKTARNAAIRLANREHLYRLHEIGSFIGLHLSTVSKIANAPA